MELDTEKLKTALFSSDRNTSFIRQMNQALKYLIEKDNTFVNMDKSAPAIWECKWLNQPKRISGYPKGYAVWLNTNTYDQILASNKRTIESYVINNSTLNSLYNSINPSDTAAQNQFLIDAAKGTASNAVSAIYCLGDVSQKTQIRISLKDDNRAYPTDLCCWKDFFEYTSYEENVSILLSAAKDVMNDSISTHIDEYHLPGITSASMQLSGYFTKTPFQISSVQSQNFFDHNYCDEMRGFDYVVRQKMAADGSSWCRIWKSGYIEQGGFANNIPGQAFIPVSFMTTYNYPVGPSFYQRDYQSYAGAYSISNPLQANNRYIVTVTPILRNDYSMPYPERPIDIGNELIYSSVDITNMSNYGFSIVNTDMQMKRYTKYSWYACGYKVINFPSQMFDGASPAQIPANSAFGITPEGNLTSFTDHNYEVIAVPDNVLSISNNVFNGCQNAKVITLPNGLTTIGTRAFYNCDYLQGISIPDSVMQIPAEAFSNSQRLTYVGMGEKLNFIGVSAFYNDPSLALVSRFQDIDPSHTFDKVGNYAFYKTSMRKLNLSLRSAGIDNFWGDYCFAENKHLEEVNILSACYMSTNMFKNCTSLKTVNFKNNHTSYVYPDVFNGCSSLTGITLPSKIWYISEEMFKNCKSLQYVKFTDYSENNSAINLIQKNAFNGCTSLQSLELPASLTSIDQLDDACLCGCTLTSINFHGISKSNLLKSNGSLVDKLYQTGMFRLSSNCTIVCKEGDTFNFQFNESMVTPYSAPTDYNDEAVDRTAASNFKRAKDAGARYWYYNARQLCEYSDTARVPCLFIYSLLGCKPCQTYMKKIFNNAAFQSWAAQQNFFLCGMEVDKQPYYDQQLAFCVNELVPNCQNFAKEDQGQSLDSIVPNALGNKYKRWRVDEKLLNSNLTTPVLVFRYNNGTATTSFAHTFHNIDKQISRWGLNQVIQCIKSLCLYYFDNNSLVNPKFVVNAGQAFNINDYPSINDPVVPPADYTVIPTAKDTDHALTTVSEVISDIKARIPASDSDGDTPYLMNCNFDDVPYLVDTFEGINDCTTIDQVNLLVNSGINANYRFKIGNNYFKFSLSTNVTKEIGSCAFGVSTVIAGMPVFTAVS